MLEKQMHQQVIGMVTGGGLKENLHIRLSVPPHLVQEGSFIVVECQDWLYYGIATDLQLCSIDPRYALHSGSIDPPAWEGDAKVAGRAEEITDPERVLAINGGEVGPSHLFRLDVSEVVVVSLNEAQDKLVIESWHAGRGLTRLER